MTGGACQPWVPPDERDRRRREENRREREADADERLKQAQQVYEQNRIALAQGQKPPHPGHVGS